MNAATTSVACVACIAAYLVLKKYVRNYDAPIYKGIAVLCRCRAQALQSKKYA
jgi:hypothetical protein